MEQLENTIIENSDDNQAELDQAIISALANITNCSKRIDGFTKASFENYKRNYSQIYRILERNGAKAANPNEWLIWLSEMAAKSENHIIKESASTTFGLVMDRETDYPVELNYWITDQKQMNSSDFRDSKLTATIDQNHTKPLKEDEKQRTNQTQQVKEMEFLKYFFEWNIQNKQFRIETLRDSSQDVTLWFERFELQTPGWTDEARSSQVVSLFEDDALQKFRLMKTNKSSYLAIKRNLITNFRHDRTSDIQCDFYGAKQRADESVEKFSNRLLRYTNEVNEMEKEIMEKKLANVFLRGLTPSLKKIISISAGKDFDELVRIAKRVEQCEKEEQEITSIEAGIESINYIRNNQEQGKKDKVVCVICDKNNHETAKCFKLKSVKDFIKNQSKQENKESTKSQKGYQNLFCSHCNRPNHDYENCRMRLGLCIKCGKKGHLAKHCNLNS